MAKTKILIIAGDTKVASKGEGALKHLGYLVKTAPVLDQSLQLIKKQKPDVVISIPSKENVKEFIQAGREIDLQFKIPVIYLVSEKNKARLKRAKLRERLDYLSDAFGDHELYFAVETALSRRGLLQAETQEDVLSAEEYFQKFLTFAPNAFIVIDEQGVIQFENTPAEELLGCPRDQLIGKNFEMLIPERFRTNHEVNQKNYLAHPKTRAVGIGLDVFCLRADGTEIPVEIGLTPVTLNGRTYVLVSIADISIRKQSEASLRQAETRYRTLVEQIPPIVYIAGLDQHVGVTYVSPRISILGFTQAEWVSDPELWFRQIYLEDQKRILADIERSATSGEPFRSEYRIQARDGSVKWFLDEAMDVLDSDGHALFRQGFMLDITDRKLAEESLASRERYLELLNDMTRAVLLAGDINSTLNILAVDMAKIIEADDCYITSWDAEKQLTIPTATTANLASPYVNRERKANELSMTASVIKTGRVLAADDVMNSPFINPDIARQYPAKSILGIPLIAGELQLGAAIIAFNTPHHFTEQEIERAELVGHQIALALQYLQRGADVQQRLKESNALAQIGRVLSATEHTGTEQVLQLIVDSARDLISHAEESVIHLLEPEEQVLIAQAVSGFSDEDRALPRVQMRLGEGVAGQVINEGITINIGDIENDPRFVRGNFQPKFYSLLVAPIQSGGQQIGTISVQSDQKFAFTAQDVELLKALAIQAAIAIENTRLFESTQQQLKEADALYKTSQGLATSLDADQLIKDVVLMLHQNFGYYHVQVYFVEPASGDLVLKSSSGDIGAQLLAENFRLIRGRGIVGHVAETGKSFVTNNVNAVVFFDRNPLLPDTQSEMTVPIKVNQEVVGVLDIQQTPPNKITYDELQLMMTVAEQLAVALQKANLYKDLQTALQQEKTIRSQLVQNERLALVGRLLASVSHELNNPLQAIQNALFLLKDETKLSSQASQDLDIILSETERMAALIERLRSAYRPIRVTDFQPVGLNGLIEDVHTLITTHMRQKDIAFEFYPDPELPLILGLSDQLRQVALNLFLNAIEVMQPGGRLTVLTCGLPAQNEIQLTVKDTGPGIDFEILPHIFDPFITSKYTGTGLGLTITHDIIQQHYGRIVAENDPEGGAVFKVWLPVDRRGKP